MNSNNMAVMQKSVKYELFNNKAAGFLLEQSYFG